MQQTISPKSTSKRNRAINELVETEETYVKRLGQLIEHFVDPLAKNTKLMSKADHAIVFPSDIKIIYNFHKIFLKKLRESKSKIGDAFEEFAPYFKMYQNYLNNHEKATAKLTKLEKNKQFLSFCLNQRQYCDMQSLSSLLILPIQRIPRYELCLKEIIKNSVKEEEKTDLWQLKEELEQVKEISQTINQRMKEFESRQNVRNIESRFYNLNKLKGGTLIAPARQFLFESKQYQIELIDKNGNCNCIILFLFSDCMVYGIETLNENENNSNDTNTNNGNNSNNSNGFSETSISISPRSSPRISPRFSMGGKNKFGNIFKSSSPTNSTNKTNKTNNNNSQSSSSDNQVTAANAVLKKSKTALKLFGLDTSLLKFGALILFDNVFRIEDKFDKYKKNCLEIYSSTKSLLIKFDNSQSKKLWTERINQAKDDELKKPTRQHRYQSKDGNNKRKLMRQDSNQSIEESISVSAVSQSQTMIVRSDMMSDDTKDEKIDNLNENESDQMENNLCISLDEFDSNSQQLLHQRPLMIPDDFTSKCMRCHKKFSLLNRRHHCYFCGLLCCNKCSDYRLYNAFRLKYETFEIISNYNTKRQNGNVPILPNLEIVRVCLNCFEANKHLVPIIGENKGIFHRSSIYTQENEINRLGLKVSDSRNENLIETLNENDTHDDDKQDDGMKGKSNDSSESETHNDNDDVGSDIVSDTGSDMAQMDYNDESQSIIGRKNASIMESFDDMDSNENMNKSIIGRQNGLDLDDANQDKVETNEANNAEKEREWQDDANDMKIDFSQDLIGDALKKAMIKGKKKDDTDNNQGNETQNNKIDNQSTSLDMTSLVDTNVVVFGTVVLAGIVVAILLRNRRYF